MDNLRGIFFMTLAMAGFALEDLIIKMLSDFMPVSQILIYVGTLATILLSIISKIKKIPVITRAIFCNKALIFRTFMDMFGAVFIVSAISLIPLSTVSSILQVAPLLVTLGSALIFKENVGWRRWTAVFTGFIGVILILKPGLNGFQLSTLLAMVGVVFLALRDLATRRIGENVPSMTVSIYAFTATIIGGVIVLPFNGDFIILNGSQLLLVLASSLVACFAYLTLVLATRAGDISIIAPFRYTRLIFALALAVFILNERPDALTLIGAFMIIASGCYTFWRENVKKSQLYQ